jgi:hypothetical protein
MHKQTLFGNLKGKFEMKANRWDDKININFNEINCSPPAEMNIQFQALLRVRVPKKAQHF